MINLDMFLTPRNYMMPLPKNCEWCKSPYTCREDKVNTSRFCSRICTSKNAGTVAFIKCKERWAQDSAEEFRLKMKLSLESFFNKTDDNTCWLWIKKRGKQSNDYGNFTFRGIAYKSNRATWLVYRGDIPIGMYVLHRCDIRSCVNPDHLFLGTHTDNMKDMAAKKRARPRCKLTYDQVVEIRRLFDLGVTMANLARKYRVTQTCMHYIKYRKSWIS